MLISHAHQFIFIHVHRTGGSSLGTFLKEQLKKDVTIISQHGNVNSDDAQYIDKYPDYFVFGFVRNPWDRLLSWYFLIYQNNLLPLKEEQLRFEKFLAEDEAFKKGDRYFFYNQVDYFTDSNGHFLANQLFKFEHYTDEIKLISKKFDLQEAPIQKLNNTFTRNYKNYYTFKSIEMVAKKCHKDLLMLNYSF